jgi:polyisoprenyl-teichoic acid--peptidoglycan teichoic acid transferase
MDDFRNKQQSRPSSAQNNSIDGFSKPRRRRPPAPSNLPTGQKQLDRFSGQDGFSTTNRSRNIQSPTSSINGEEPLLITKKPHGRRRGPLGWLRRRKDGPKKPWSKKRKILTGIGVFLAILMLIFGFLVLKGYINLNKILGGGGGAAALEKNVDPSKLKGEGDGRVNVLMLGRGGDGHDGADLTDTIILASIDPIAKEASLLSIPRDLYVPVKGQGSMKINAVFATGKSASLNRVSKQTNEAKKQAEEAGYSLLEKTIEDNLGVPIHYRTTIDFNGFKQAVDTVGGVEVNAPTAVKETMRIDGKTYKLDVKSGKQHMDGFKALAYSRSRHTSARGDFDRSERQRLIIIALKEKIMSAGTYSNPSKIAGLLDNLGSHVSTNFNVHDLSRLYDLGKEIDKSKISSIGLADPPNNYVTTSTIGGQSVVVPRAGVGNYKEIQSYMRNALKDSFLKNENANIAVYNGTSTAGLAGTKAEELKSFGYNITTVANAPSKNYPKTIIVDLRGESKKYTKNYLEKRFGVSTVSSIPDPSIKAGTADFVIILGSDQAR